MKRKLLFVTYGGAHAHMVYPVVQRLYKSELYKSNELDIKVLGLPAAKPILRTNGVNCFGFEDYLDKSRDTDALAWGEALAEKHHSSTIGASLEETIAYLGLSYKDLVLRFGEEEAHNLFKRKQRQAFYPITILERIINDIQPDFVITTESPRAEAAAIEVANSKNIHTLSMTGVIDGIAFCPLKAKHVTFLNEFAKSNFIKNNAVDARLSNLYCTGNPAFDTVIKSSVAPDPEWMKSNFLDIDLSKPIVLHADTHSYWDPYKKCSYFRTNDEIIEELEVCYEAAIRNRAIYLVRPHPSQDRSFYENWVKGKADAYLAVAQSLPLLMSNMDLLLVRISTVSLEAVYMRKKILQIGASFHKSFPLAGLGVAWGAENLESIGDEMKKALEDDKNLEKIRANMDKTFPKQQAAEKITQIILNQI